jgi:CRP/FNR family transcriptional regulator, cyclic AMP receptor protein
LLARLIRLRAKRLRGRSWRAAYAQSVTSIADHCHEQTTATVPAGVVLLEEGQRTGRLYVLLDGAVEILKGDFQINLVSGRGAVFGDMSALLDMPHMATVRTLTECKMYAIEDGAGFLESNKEVAFLLAQLLAQRLHGVTTYLADLKAQFEDQENHLSMVDEILETLVHDQRREFTPGSDRDPDY